MFTLLPRILGRPARRAASTARRTARALPQLESLEDRCVLSYISFSSTGALCSYHIDGVHDFDKVRA
jgi:hypothetical protein